PAVGRALPMKQVGILDRVGDVVALSVTVLRKIIGNFDIERPLRIREAFEFDARLLACDAAGPFGADKIASGDRFSLAILVRDPDLDGIAALLEAGKGGRHPDGDQRMRFRHVERFFNDLDPLALENERKLRIVLEMDMVEFRDQRAILAVPVPEYR